MESTNPFDVSGTLAERLASYTVAHRDAQETARACAKKWKDAVVEAIDSGMLVREVAGLAKVSAARVHAIVADVYSKG